MSGYLNNPDNNAASSTRLLIALAVAAVLMMAYQAIFPPPMPPAAPSDGSGEQAEELEPLELADSDNPESVDPSGALAPTDIVNHTLQSDAFRVTLTNQGGRIRGIDILAPEQYLPREEMAAVFPERDDDALPLGLLVGIETLQADTLFHVIAEDTDDQSVHWQRQLSNGLVIDKTVSLASTDYSLNASFVLTNRSSDRMRLPSVDVLLPGSVRSDAGGGIFAGYGSRLQTICDGEFGTERRPAAKADEPRVYDGLVHFAGINETYFLHALIPDSQDTHPASACSVRGLDEDHALVTITHGEVTLDPGDSVTFNYRLFAGPKDLHFLTPMNADLQRSLDFGWFSFLAVPIRSILLWIQSWATNWGLSIIVLTLMLNFVLFPMRLSMYRNSRKMAEMNKVLQPRLKEVEKRYPNDPMKKAEEQSRVMKELGVNPLAGCLPMLLPMLIQMPIFFSMFRAILNSTELYNAPFTLWIVDLSQPDPFYVLPIAIGLLFFIQQKLMPAPSVDNQQVIMMQRLMPLIFTALMLFMPAGLVLYSLVNTLVAIVQQKLLGGGGSAMPTL